MQRRPLVHRPGHAPPLRYVFVNDVVGQMDQIARSCDRSQSNAVSGAGASIPCTFGRRGVDASPPISSGSYWSPCSTAATR